MSVSSDVITQQKLHQHIRARVLATVQWLRDFDREVRHVRNAAYRALDRNHF